MTARQNLDTTGPEPTAGTSSTVWFAYTATAWMFAFGLVRAHWAFDSGLLVLALVSAFGCRLPRWLLRTPGCGAPALMVGHAVPTLIDDASRIVGAHEPSLSTLERHSATRTNRSGRSAACCSASPCMATTGAPGRHDPNNKAVAMRLEELPTCHQRERHRIAADLPNTSTLAAIDTVWWRDIPLLYGLRPLGSLGTKRVRGDDRFLAQKVSGGDERSTETRALLCTDPVSRRKFDAYGLLIRVPSGQIRREGLPAICRRATGLLAGQQHSRQRAAGRP